MPLPRAIVCNLCGAQHLKTSFQIHYKACAKLHPEEYARIQKQVQKKRDARKKAHPALGRGIGAGGGNKVGSADPATLTEMEDFAEFAEEDVIRYACKVCDRKFLKDRVEKHESICVKLAKKRKRKAYNTGHHRVAGTPFAEFEHHRSQTPREILMWKKRGWRRWRHEAKQLRQAAGIKLDGIEKLERKDGDGGGGASIKTERSAITRKPLAAATAVKKGHARKISGDTRFTIGQQTRDAGTAGAPNKAATRKASAGISSGKTRKTGASSVAGSSSPNKAPPRSRVSAALKHRDRRSPTKGKTTKKAMPSAPMPVDENSTAGGDPSKPPTSMSQYLEREKVRAAAAQRRGGTRRGIAGGGGRI